MAESIIIGITVSLGCFLIAVIFAVTFAPIFMSIYRIDSENKTEKMETLKITPLPKIPESTADKLLNLEFEKMRLEYELMVVERSMAKINEHKKVESPKTEQDNEFYDICEVLRSKYSWNNPDCLKGIYDIIAATKEVIENKEYQKK